MYSSPGRVSACQCPGPSTAPLAVPTEELCAQGCHLVASAVCYRTAQFHTQAGRALCHPLPLIQDNGLDYAQGLPNPAFKAFCGRNVGLQAHNMSLHPYFEGVSWFAESYPLSGAPHTDGFCDKKERGHKSIVYISFARHQSWKRIQKGFNPSLTKPPDTCTPPMISLGLTCFNLVNTKGNNTTADTVV